jgi:transposase
MGKTKILNLTTEQRMELEKGLKYGSCHRFRMRCQGVLLKANGMKGEEISAIVGYGKIAVFNWVKRFEKNGMDGLREKGSRGPKPLMGEADTPAVKEAVREHRESIKTAKAAWQKKSQKEVSDATFRRFLDSLAQDINV